MKFREIVVQWIQRSLLGIGCSLIASAAFGIMLPGTPPFGIAVALVGGLVFLLVDLVVSIAINIPKGD